MSARRTANRTRERGPAPAGELAQVQGVRLAGQAAVSGQVPGEGEPFGVGEGGLDRGERGGWGGSDHRVPRGRAGTGRPGQFRSQRLSGNSPYTAWSGHAMPHTIQRPNLVSPV